MFENTYTLYFNGGYIYGLLWYPLIRLVWYIKAMEHFVLLVILCAGR